MVVLLNGCSALEMASTAAGAAFGSNDGLSVDTELVVGDKQEEIQVGNRTGVINNTAENIQIDEVDYFLILLLLLGWMLPSPSQMFKEVKSWFKRK